MEAFVDVYEGQFNRRRVIEKVTLEEIDRLVRSMDGIGHTSMGLFADDGTQLLLGGGAKGRIHVAFFTDRDSFVLEDPDVPEGTIDIVIGNSLTPLDQRYLVSTEEAALVARRFFSGADVRTVGLWKFV